MNKEDLNSINNRLDKLEKKINNFIDRFDSSIANDIDTNESKKIHIQDIEKLYNSKDFETFYDECRKYDYSEGEEVYADDVNDGETFFSRLFLCLAYFDIGKIAKHITYINKNEVNKDHVLKSIDVTDETSYVQWRKCLLNCLEQAVESLVEHGEADKEHTFKKYQVGRIHLNSMYVTYEEESTNMLNLYWTNDDVDACSSSWE